MRSFAIGLVFIARIAFGQVPAGYYDGTEGLSGQLLRAELQSIIDDHLEQSYASIWTHFQITDVNPNGKVWDMYSDIPGGVPAYTYAFVSDQCGNYSSEGDCYNREHSFPKSWFNDAAPMVTDLFHIYPTDGYVNGKRSNYPFGEVNTPSWISTNGSKLGNSSFPGYSGIVFEPIDEYKGDFARTYFYMMTRYMDEVSSWSCDMLTGNDLSAWAKELLLQWDDEDPVSQKETDRNNAVYQIQQNRNPFIDHPEFAVLIWGLPTKIDDPNLYDLKVWYYDRNIHLESTDHIIGTFKISTINGIPLDQFILEGSSLSIPCALNAGIYIAIIETRNEIKTYKLIIL